ncbi:hypothetical protein LAT59_04700, partial [Candidatus Gracilibacteria bacterium]|nr:hypothetical protein [Candidatus Gracilibacteria bacterium]
MKKIFSVLVISFFIGVVLFLQAYAQSDNFPSNTFGSSTTTSQPSLESTKSCPEYWMPVCAQPPMPRCPEGLSCLTVMPPLKTYSNKECAAVDNAELVYEGECRGDNDSRPNPRPACRKDAKVCPDGSTVERTGSNCEFAA